MNIRYVIMTVKKNNSKFDWKKFCLNLGFIACFAISFTILDKLFFDETQGSTVWEDVQNEDGPEVLFRGNSHAHCSFIPDILDSALGIDTAVLTSSAQPMYVTVENLKTVLNYYVPKLIILESNAIHADNREAMQGKSKAATMKNIDGIYAGTDKLRTAVQTLKFEDIPLAFTQMCRKDLMYSRWYRIGKGMHENYYQRQDIQGYQIRNTCFGGVEKILDVQNFYIPTDGEQLIAEARIREPLNEKALHEFLQLAEKNGIEVWIVKAPTLTKYENLISTMVRIREIAYEYSAVTHIMDLHGSMMDMGLTPSDFYDREHLNRRGAAKCTVWFGDVLGEWLGVMPNYEKVFFYKNENIEKVGDNLFQYTMEAFGDTQFRFEQKIDGKYVCIADWSEHNDVVIELSPENADQLRVTMLPAGVSADNAATQGLTLNFMVPNASK